MLDDREKLEYLAKKANELLEQCQLHGEQPMNSLYRLVRLIDRMVEEKAP